MQSSGSTPRSAADVRLALFKEVHANLPALDEVLADIQRIGVDVTHALGDMVGYAPWPNEVSMRRPANSAMSAWRSPSG